MDCYIEDPKNSTRSHLILIDKLKRDRIQIQHTKAFLYINNESIIKEIMKTIPFRIAPKKEKYMGIDLSSKVKYFYDKIMLIQREIRNTWKVEVAI